MKKIISKYDIIINLAALVGAPLCEKNKTDAYLVNERLSQVLKDNLFKDQILMFNNTNSGYRTNRWEKSLC